MNFYHKQTNKIVNRGLIAATTGIKLEGLTLDNLARLGYARIIDRFENKSNEASSLKLLKGPLSPLPDGSFKQEYIPDIDILSVTSRFEQLLERIDSLEDLITTTVVVTVSGGKYYVDGAEAPTLTFERGKIYIFDISDATVSGHPLALYEDSGKTTEFHRGVTTNYVDKLIFRVGKDEPLNVVYYQCASHVGMGGAINITD